MKTYQIIARTLGAACPILGGRCYKTYGTKLLGSVWRWKRRLVVLVGFYRNGAHFRTRESGFAARFHYIRKHMKQL